MAEQPSPLPTDTKTTDAQAMEVKRTNDGIVDPTIAGTVGPDQTRTWIAKIAVCLGLLLIVVPLVATVFTFESFLNKVTTAHLEAHLPWLLAAKAVVVASSMASGAALFSLASRLLRPLWFELRLAEMGVVPAAPPPKRDVVTALTEGAKTAGLLPSKSD